MAAKRFFISLPSLSVDMNAEAYHLNNNFIARQWTDRRSEYSGHL